MKSVGCVIVMRKLDTVLVVVIDEEKEKTHKTEKVVCTSQK